MLAYKNCRLLLCLALTLLLSACSAPKKISYFDQVTPHHVVSQDIEQMSLGYPPLYQPVGKRATITPKSQYFTLAIPNCIDVTGRAKDLRKSLADMLYTELFQSRRFNLYDRNELVNLNTDWIEAVLKKSYESSYSKRYVETSSQEGLKEVLAGPQAVTRKDVEDHYQANSLEPDFVGQAIAVQDRKAQIEEEAAEKLRQNTDGLLMVYITERSGNEEGGFFYVDYRIVSNDKVVLFAASQKIRFSVSTAKAIEYNREDISAISANIVQVFPNPETNRRGQVVSIDGERIVLDLGKEDHIIPGLRGYVVTADDSIYTSDDTKARHLDYLAFFYISEVYRQTSTGTIILDSEEDDAPDIRVGDEIVLK